jgi:hypothetical protein
MHSDMSMHVNIQQRQPILRDRPEKGSIIKAGKGIEISSECGAVCCRETEVPTNFFWFCSKFVYSKCRNDGSIERQSGPNVCGVTLLFIVLGSISQSSGPGY